MTTVESEVNIDNIANEAIRAAMNGLGHSLWECTQFNKDSCDMEARVRAICNATNNVACELGQRFGDAFDRDSFLTSVSTWAPDAVRLLGTNAPRGMTYIVAR